MPTQYYSGWNYKFPQFTSAPWLGTDSNGKVTNLGQTGATATYVLTANGVGVVPSWQVVPTSTVVLTGDTGGTLTSHSFTLTAGTTGLSIGGSGTTFTLTGTLVVANGGTGIATTTAYAPICGGTTATGAFQAASTGLSTSGYILTSNGNAAVPSFQAPASQLMVFTAKTTSPIALVTNNGYGSASGTITFNLPASAAVGDRYRVVGMDAGTGWIIQAGAGQTIYIGSQKTSVAGTLSSTDKHDCVEIVCMVANTGFNVISSMGNITYA